MSTPREEEWRSFGSTVYRGEYDELDVVIRVEVAEFPDDLAWRIARALNFYDQDVDRMRSLMKAAAGLREQPQENR